MNAELNVLARNAHTEFCGSLAGAIARRERVSGAETGPTEIVVRQMEAPEAAATEELRRPRSRVAQLVAGNETLPGVQQELGGQLNCQPSRNSLFAEFSRHVIP